MNIQNELIYFLTRNLKESVNKTRNIGITTFYYGFGETSWPTYEETANILMSAHENEFVNF